MSDNHHPQAPSSTSGEPRSSSGGLGDAGLAAAIPSVRTRVVRTVITIGVVVAVFAGIFPRFADYSEVAPILTDLTPSEVAVLGVLALWFLSAYWPVLMAVIPSLRLREAAVNQLAGTALSNTVPAGGAFAVGVNYSMYVSWGFTPSQIWAGLLTAGVWDGLIKAGLPLVALSLFAVLSDVDVVSWTVPVLGGALLAVMSLAVIAILRSERGATAVGRIGERLVNPVLRIAHRPTIDIPSRLLDFRTTLVGLLRRAWLALTGAMLANHLAMFAVFAASLRFTGADDVSIVAMLVSFSLARLLSGVPLTPGGLGVVDAGYVALLSLTTPDSPEAAIVAGVLLFRALTFFPPIPFGVATWLFWRTNRSWRRPMGTRATNE